MPRKNTGEWRPAFLAYLRKHPNVLKAAQAAKIERRMAYKARYTDPEFAQAWDDAIGESIDRIEELAIDGALSGDARWITMMIFMLKAHKPERYKETYVNEIVGRDGGDVVVKVLRGVSLDDL